MSDAQEVLEFEKKRILDDKFFKILAGILKLEIKCGHLKWKVSELSRVSKVQRPLIYYYFGKSKEKMVQQALETISSEVFGFDHSKLELWKSGKYAEAVMFSKWTAQQYPELIQFFFYWKTRREHDIGKFIRGLEARYVAKLKITFPQLSTSRIHLLMASLYGFVLTEHGGEAEARELFETLTQK